MIIWSQRLGIKLPEQNQRSVIVIWYAIASCSRMKEHEQTQKSGKPYCCIWLWKILKVSVYKQEINCVIQNKMSLSERHSSEIPSTLLSPLHPLNQQPLPVVLQIISLTRLLFWGTAPTVTSVTFQNQGMEQPINFFMALLLLICYIFIS